MKTLMTFLFLAAALFPIQGSAHDDLRWSTATAIEVVFDRQMDIESLVKLKQDLTAQGVELTYTKLEFDPQGKLLMIDFSVSADGYNGSASSGDLEKGTFGFRIDRTEGAQMPFSVGNFKR